MALLTGVSEFFGLDIGTVGVRLVELRGKWPAKSLLRYAYVPVDLQTSTSDSKADQLRMAGIIKNLLQQAQITTTNVVVNIPSKRVFTTVVDVDKMNKKDLEKSIKFQVGSLIPTAVENSKIDWEVIGDSPKDPNKVELLLSSVPNEFAEQRLDLLESIGLNVIAFEPDNLALSRALLDPSTANPQMVLDVGATSTDLVIVMNGIPRLTRSITIGIDSIIKAASQNLNIDMKQAHDLVYKFGVNKTKLEGQVYQAIISIVDLLLGEADKSIKFFENRYVNAKLERIVVTGAASTLPDFPVYMGTKLGISIEIGNAWRNVQYPPERQNELLQVSHLFGVATGLALRDEM